MRDRRYIIDLGRHLTVCDGNYLRLTKLMPNLGRHAQDAGFAGDRRAFRVPVGGASPAVTIEVVECSRYTTTLAVAQLSGGREIADLSMKVRLYHDARSAEVVEFQGKRWFESAYDYPNREMRQPDEKAQVNRFLSEFLNACLRHGVASEEAVEGAVERASEEAVADAVESAVESAVEDAAEDAVESAVEHRTGEPTPPRRKPSTPDRAASVAAP